VFGLIQWFWACPMTPHLQMNWFIEVMDVVTDGPAPVILIVESYPDLRMLAAQFVKEEGFETLEAGDADQAIAMLESRSEIAVLFTNIDLPGSMNGPIKHHPCRPPGRLEFVACRAKPRSAANYGPRFFRCNR
jgi:hypothetical protein